jgi:hypothetical protein
LQSSSRLRRWLAGYLGIPLVWWLTGLHMHIAEFVFPPLGVWPAFFIEAIFLAWLLRRFDVLTVMAAVFTAVLWIMNYPLLDIFQEVGNGTHVAVLWGWALVAIGAAAMAFRRQLMDRWQGIRAQME